jgi:tRNA(Ile)-lysidine synthase
MALIDAIREQLTRLRVMPSGLVVAVSGGADSVALLLALTKLRPSPLGGRGDGGEGGEPIVIAHLNHCLRGDESDGDEQFVRQLHADLVNLGARSLELAVARIDVAALAAQSGGNLEATARRERYRWLAETALRFNHSRVATGHTADDQAETVLHRLLRGTGLQGLRGIAVRRELQPGIELIRPMLTATRADVLAFLRENDHSYREDRSNADLTYTRNRIRHELLPLLTANYNQSLVSHLGQLAEQASEVFSELERQAGELLQTCELPPAGPLRILDAVKLARASRQMVREALRLLWQREQWSRDGMTFQDWDRAAAVALGELPAVDLPGRISVRRKGSVVQLGSFHIFTV